MTSLGKIKEISVKMKPKKKQKKVTEMKVVWVTFLVHLSSPVMANLGADSSAG